MNEEEKVEMREAVKEILRHLPDRDIDLSVVLIGAVNKLSFDGRSRFEAENLLLQLIRLCPRCFGVDRKPGFWRIVRQFLSDEETVQAYLIRFKDQITERQCEYLKWYLLHKLGFDPVMVKHQLEQRQFVTVMPVGRRPSNKTYHPWFV